MTTFDSPVALLEISGELGTSDWLTIDQARINGFADTTDDHQWIHVDPDRARGGPLGTTIAHGYLSVSLVSATPREPGVEAAFGLVVEIDGTERPACVAELVVLYA